jgi:hypothetical protein
MQEGQHRTSRLLAFYAYKNRAQIMTGFNDIAGSFEQKGLDLRKDEADAIRSLIISKTTSPKFVRLLIKEYGSPTFFA